jgi:hypothetical protein
MADASARKKIRLALVERLRGIRQAAGYATDAGLRVLHGEPPVTSEQDPGPVVGLVAGDAALEVVTLERRATYRWPFVAHGAIAADPADPLALPGEDLLADLKRALFQVDDGQRVTLGGLVDDLEPAAGAQVVDRVEGGATATCALPFVLVFGEDWGQP